VSCWNASDLDATTRSEQTRTLQGSLVVINVGRPPAASLRSSRPPASGRTGVGDTKQAGGRVWETPSTVPPSGILGGDQRGTPPCSVASLLASPRKREDGCGRHPASGRTGVGDTKHRPPFRGDGRVKRARGACEPASPVPQRWTDPTKADLGGEWIRWGVLSPAQTGEVESWTRVETGEDHV